MKRTDEAELTLRILGQSIERSPRAKLVLDDEWTVLLANRQARLRTGLAPASPFLAACVQGADRTSQVLQMALGTSQSLPLRLTLADEALAFMAWRIDDLPGFSRPMLMLAADPANSIAARMNAMAITQERTRFRLAALEHERDSLRRSARRLEKMAQTDLMTGLLNAVAFRTHCSARLARSGLWGTILIADLNRFKPINDHYGHDAGDHVLRNVARRLSEAVRENDLVGRLGGDEFGVWLEDCGQTPLAERVAQLRSLLARPIAWRSPEGQSTILPPVQAAFGMASAPQEGTDIDLLMRLADTRMFRDKPDRGSQRSLGVG